MRIPITIDGRRQPLRRAPEPLGMDRRPGDRYGYPRRSAGWGEPEPLTGRRTSLGEDHRTLEDDAEGHSAFEGKEALTEQPVPSPKEPRAGTEEPDRDWKDRYVRLLADFENYKRHTETQRERLSGIGKAEVLEDFFPLVEHMERAIRAARDADDRTGILQGIEMVYRELLGILEKHGVERIETLGRPFDPQIHEAVAVSPHRDGPAGTVVEATPLRASSCRNVGQSSDSATSSPVLL